MNLQTHCGTERFWSRAPGLHVDKYTGSLEHKGHNGTILDWYMTLVPVVENAVRSIGGNVTNLVSGSVPFLILEHLPNFKPLLVDDKIDRTCGILLLDKVELLLTHSKDLPKDTLYVVNDHGLYLPVRILDRIKEKQ